MSLDVQAASGDGLLHSRTFTLSAVDATLPVVLSFEPGQGERLPGTTVGASILVTIRAQDPGLAQLTSGIAGVQVQVDQQGWANAQPDAAPGTWTARIFVPGADEHRISVRAVDAAGRTSAVVSHTVVVTVPRKIGRPLGTAAVRRQPQPAQAPQPPDSRRRGLTGPSAPSDRSGARRTRLKLSVSRQPRRGAALSAARLLRPKR